MSVRLALAVLISAIFCFPCYASSALPASPSNALIKGYDIPDLPKSDSYAIIKNTVSFSTNKDYADYILFAFFSPPVVMCDGYGFQDNTIEKTSFVADKEPGMPWLWYGIWTIYAGNTLRRGFYQYRIQVPNCAFRKLK